MTKTYMVFVEGKQQPSVAHASITEAIKEAKRLSEKSDVKGRAIYVFKVEGIYQPGYSWTHCSDDLTAEQVAERIGE